MLIGSLANIKEIFRQAREHHEPVIFPTDTIYGIGAPISDTTANEKIYEIKGREKNKPFPVLISNYKQANDLAEITDFQIKIIKKLWPGKFTLILKAKKNIDSLYVLDGKIALRMPSEQWLSDLIQYTGAISATSANRSGIEYEPDETYILRHFSQTIKYFVINRTNDTNSSTIIDLTGNSPKIIRGEINLHEILSEKEIL